MIIELTATRFAGVFAIVMVLQFHTMGRSILFIVYLNEKKYILSNFSLKWRKNEITIDLFR